MQSALSSHLSVVFGVITANSVEIEAKQFTTRGAQRLSVGVRRTGGFDCDVAPSMRGVLRGIMLRAVRGLLQRVSNASVTVDSEVVSSIGPGLCALVGVGLDDDIDAADRLAAKIWQIRVFPDDAGNMNRSAADLSLELLVVSQFTLYADTSRGRRPSFVNAAAPAVAEPLIDRVVDQLRRVGAEVATGRFGATMKVTLVNDGPVTIMVET
jgi:D-aminoacyl-tRNA deacylase